MRSELSEALIQLRKDLGMKSALAFFKFLDAKTRLDFNYSYYARIEAAKVMPSAKVVNTIASAVDETQGKALVLAYCSDLFPKHRTLFERPAWDVPARALKQASGETGPLTKQKFLTPAQVNTISRSQTHYYLFLLLTLARTPIPRLQLSTLFSETKSSAFLQAVDDLIHTKIIYEREDSLESISSEMKFPKAETEALKKTYFQMDSWDTGFARTFGFQTIFERMALRRVSGRCLAMIASHAKLLEDLIHSSEEVDPSFNNEVLYLNLKLSQGRLPG